MLSGDGNVRIACIIIIIIIYNIYKENRQYITIHSKEVLMDHKSVFQTLSQIPPTPVIHLLKEDELMSYWYFQHFRDR